MHPIRVIGGGLAGLTAAIACAELGARVELAEAHDRLGGRARSAAGPYIANEGPHAFYSDGAPYRWLAERGLVQPDVAQSPDTLTRTRLRYRGELTAAVPAALRQMVSQRAVIAPADCDFTSWATGCFGADAAAAACGVMGIVTYSARVGALSAAFVWDRLLRVLPPGLPAVRYPVGGWSAVIARMSGYATSLGVRITTGARVAELPPGPVIVATSLDAARSLLRDASLRWESGHAVLLDLGLEAADQDLFLVSDLDDGGFVERFSLTDPSLAPAGHALVQAMMPVRPGEPGPAAAARLERLVGQAIPGWRDRVRWRHAATVRGRTGALDQSGLTWADRPAVGRGGGVWLAGDSVAAPGLLSEVSVASALTAARAAVGYVREGGARWTAGTTATG
jgi:phytoene dehydrogenase-like protein